MARDAVLETDQWFHQPAEKPSEGNRNPTRWAAGSFDSLEVYVDPRAEGSTCTIRYGATRGIFFNDPGLHGLNLRAKKEYEPYLENIASRDDLNYLFIEMLGDITVGQCLSAAATFQNRSVQDRTAWRDFSVEKCPIPLRAHHNGENWNPRLLRAPLTQPGVNVKTGEYLLAVNGATCGNPATSSVS